MLLTLLRACSSDPIVIHEDAIVGGEAFEWERITVEDGKPEVNVASIPHGSSVFLHYVKSLISDDEARRLIGLCDEREGWFRSPIKATLEVDAKGGDPKSDDLASVRTSSSCPLLWPFAYRLLETDPLAYGEQGKMLQEEFSLVLRLSRRVARLLKLEDYYYVEPLQLVRYTHGEYYQTHHDHGRWYGRISESRPYTLLLFLNSVPEADKGGHTSFPSLKIKILPRLGDAILWSNVDPNDLGDEPRILPEALHEAVGILQESTTKYVANVWISDRPTPHTDEVFVTK